MTFSPSFPPRALCAAAIFTTVLALTGVAGWAAEADSRHAFHIPAGDATVTLRLFAQQSGLEVLYSTREVEGAVTKLVAGDYPLREALAAMLDGSGLVATPGATGVLAVRRAPDPNAPRAAQGKPSDRPKSPPLLSSRKESKNTMKQKNPLALLLGWLAISTTQAQTDQAANDASAKPKDDVVKLSVFQVISTQEKGYIANSATPFKTRQDLTDIPQSITVVTRDMIDDIGGHDSSDILIYAGAIPKYRSEAFSLRGSNTGVTYPLIDGQIDRSIFMDNFFVDSYEVIKGPAALLYPNSALTGVINKNTRKPLPYASTSLRGSITDYGLYRAELDTTGPIGQAGDAKFSYRLLAGYQDGDAYFKNMKDKRILIHPSVQLDFKGTTVLLAYDHQDITHPSNPTAVLMPDGHVFTGNGREDINLPPGAMEQHVHDGFRLQVVHPFSDNWEMRLGADMNQLHRHGSIVLPIGGVDYQARTITFFNRLNDLKLNHYSLSLDVNGKYKVFGLQNQSTFGFALTDQESLQKLWTNNDFYNGIVAARIVRPLDHPDVNSLPVKPFGQYVAPANPGTKVRADLGNFYFQQNIDVIPDRLSLVAGAAYYSNETSSNANIAIRPAAATILKQNVKLHRFGIVLHVTKEIGLYAMEANTALPPTTSVLQNGNVVAPATGKGKEVGIKIDAFDSRFNATVAAFDLQTTGLTVFGGVLPSGITYVIPVGSITQRGFDGDFSLRLTPEWQLVATFYHGSVHDQAGGKVDDSYTGSYSLFTRYDFHNGPAKGLGIGGGASRILGRVVSSAGIVYPVGQTKPAFIDVAPATLANVFATYRLNRNWDFRIQCDNVFDKTYAVGINAAYLIDPSLPRSFTFSTKYRF
ncbi:MAG: Outer rane receptor for ferric coprogen and ferric-rhodotorulic acid [Verrucomicrobia bacterium]|nr:Outer rane receptor for ferric coprogen and ferric-rhodotorulic acid [Verrucomicrobiota bacterium]